MKNKLLTEYRYFLTMPYNMRVLLITNMLYSLVLPVVEIFMAAYIMRSFNNTGFVAIFQLAMYTGIIITSLTNGFLLKKFKVAHLYSFGILLSGIAMVGMMMVKNIALPGLIVSGTLIGAASGFFWTNRYLMALTSTADENRNYFFGLESFFFTVSNIVVPLVIGALLASIDGKRFLGITFDVYKGYHIVTFIVFLITILATYSLSRGRFENPVQKDFLFFRFDRLWNKQMLLAALKGLVQGFLVTAPAMLIMKYVGQEGSLGLIQSISGGLTAILIYLLGRFTKPKDRITVFAVGITIFLVGTIVNGIELSVFGVMVFVLCKVFFQPLHDLAYFPIMMKVIDVVSKKEKRNNYAYILNHEFGLFAGRAIGLGLFIFLVYTVSETFALRYALIIVAVLQMLSIPLAKNIMKESYA
ncbi:MAG: MFS transporter [Bacteroidales bacterium]|jgi:YQGE family putative transporter|nr:MFS transporter [Bacteroidales bacterium]MBP7036039.1 MFS transporter [Bacteroidales bacterium]MBP8709332.1 MFS transporter [Bacteroidales bacterium]MDI9532800.1 MFS transporter [Bacteroidota bacterium]HHV00424.1 MFS transporter [Bacteroidales bacterium]